MTNPLYTAARRQAGVITCLLAAAALLAAATGPAPAVVARQALDLLLASRFGEVAPLLSPEASEKLTADFLRERVTPELKSFGKLVEIGTPLTLKSGAIDYISFPMKFTATTVNIQFTVNESGRIAGLYFRSPEEPFPPVWARPLYSKPELFRERSVTVGTDEWKLGGTFTFPAGKGRFPVVVLVHGPGPNDRDESIGPTRMFADIAEGLASRGIAVLRYEKRTKTYGAQMAVLPFTLKEETTEDAVRALALARSQPEVDPLRVFVLGHSLGGYAVPRIAKQDGHLAGAILLAGNARRIEDISIAQIEFLLRMKGGASAAEQQRLGLMRAEAAKVRNLAPGGGNGAVLLGHPAAYFLDLKAYDAAAEARRLALPLLLLQGERDFQVTNDDLAIWKSQLESYKDQASRNYATFHSYATLNHLFIAGVGAPSPADYSKAGNVAPVVIDDIARWVEAPRR